MTQEEKELLLKDLCARLPYHPNCYCKWLEKAPNGTNGCVQELSTFVIDEIEIMDDPQFKCQICDVKPYFRPLESMTEEEIKEFILISDTVLWLGNKRSTCILSLEQIDWLNSKHLDYRGLIPMGLALPAPEGMYK